MTWIPGRTAARFCLLPLFGLSLLGACNGNEQGRNKAAPAASADAGPAVLTVGSRPVPLSVFEREFWMWSAAHPNVPADTAALRQYMPEFLEAQLLHRMALDSIPELTGFPAENLEEIKEHKMVDLVRKKGYGNIQIGERDLRRAYDLLEKKMHIRFMALASRGEAEEALRGIREGAVFARLAEAKSIDVASRKDGGDLGWLVYTDLDADIANKLFPLQEGQLLGPEPFEDQWHIYQVLEVSKNETRRPFEQVKPEIQRNMMMAAARRATRKYIDDLFARYHVRIDPAQTAWLTVFLQEKTVNAKRGVEFDEQGRPIGGYVQKSELPFESLPIPEADSGRVVATYDSPAHGGKVTPARVVDELVRKPTVGWPTFQNSKDTENLIRSLLIEELEVRDAYANKADTWPELIRHIDYEREVIRDRVFFRTRIRAKAALSNEEGIAYYEAHKAEYQEPEQRRFVGVNSARWENALKAGDLLRAGKTPEEIRSALSPSDSTIQITSSAGTGLLKQGDSPLLDRFIFKLPLHGVSDPIPVGYTFTVAKVVEILPARTRTVEEAAPEIAASIGTARFDSVKAVYVADARQKYPVEIHWDVVRRARLQMPPEGI